MRCDADARMILIKYADSMRHKFALNNLMSLLLVVEFSPVNENKNERNNDRCVCVCVVLFLQMRESNTYLTESAGTRLIAKK